MQQLPEAVAVMHQRRNFPNPIKRQAYERSQGICECHRVWQLPTYGKGCGVKLSSGNVFYEHIEPDRLGGVNDLDNCAALTKTCWKLKTSAYDRPTIDRFKRQHDRARNIRRQSFRPLPGSKASGIKLGFSHPPIWRDSGRPVLGRKG